MKRRCIMPTHGYLPYQGWAFLFIFLTLKHFPEKIFGIFHFNSYLCSAVPVRPSPRLFDAGDDPGVFVFAKVHNSFDCNNKKSIFFAFSRYLLHSQTFSRKCLHLSEEKYIFA